MFGFLGKIAGPVLGFLGAKKSNKQAAAAHARDSYNNSPQGIRANAEEAGFNPLTVLNSGRSFGAGYQPQFGNALGHLGQGITDFVTGQEQLKIQKAELELERQRVDKLAKAMTLGPKIPGIYGARNANSQSTGESLRPRARPEHDGRGGRRVSGLDPQRESWVAPGREVLDMPYTTGPGVTELDSAVTGGRPVYVPGADGEPWGFDEVLTAVVVGGPQVVWHDTVDAARRIKTNYQDLLGRPFEKNVYQPVKDWMLSGPSKESKAAKSKVLKEYRAGIPDWMRVKH